MSPKASSVLACALAVFASACARGGGVGRAENGGAENGARPAATAEARNSAAAPSAAAQSFRGTVGEGLSVRMSLRREGERLSGSYFYESVKTEITLRGRIDGQGAFTLEEFDPSGARTGVFKGRWGAADTGAAELSGRWTRPDGSRSMPFRLEEIPVEFSGGLRLVSKEIREKKGRPRYEIAVEYPQL